MAAKKIMAFLGNLTEYKGPYPAAYARRRYDE